MWKRLFDIIKTSPNNWAIFFDYNHKGTDTPLIVLEHFPEEYAGDLEKGTGDWEVSGTPGEIEGELLNKMKDIQEHK